ncbi:hypothetical protein COT51_03805 [candidate division WWE3 bacterium CG08_land_8_20_14_0_20_41_15]|uniref:Uncharacterized protein n=1 Tax=candidate division WWE3 bacterium CG08_land_8_20_14_0_20_41_15 TaxID=1975086 RepID=A0A2H0X8J0_UNCKA|nr:MAG: hypothetical protein COT51_03805 [candidate division WWE3 bacterium CG08_land_8_20_14_0_20_41_15]
MVTRLDEDQADGGKDDPPERPSSWAAETLNSPAKTGGSGAGPWAEAIAGREPAIKANKKTTTINFLNMFLPSLLGKT